MNELLVFSISVFTGFFAIMNPLANTPIFIALTDGMDGKEKKTVAIKSTVIAFIIVASFVIMGKYIFELFGITVPAFKITGGILLFYVGFEMLMSTRSKIHSVDNKEQSTGIAVSPLAIPILAGPGTIVTAMNNVNNTDFLHIWIVISIFAVMIFLTFLAFKYSERIVYRLGDNMIKVIGKIMGLILSIMGTDMVIVGIKYAFNLTTS